MKAERLTLWNRLETAGLLDAGQRAIVRAEIATWKDDVGQRVNAGTATETDQQAVEQRLADWLISHHLLTAFQAETLRRSDARPLVVGPFRLTGQAKDWGWPHLYAAALTPDRRDAWLASQPGHKNRAVANGDTNGLLEVHVALMFGHRLTADDWNAILSRVRLLQDNATLQDHPSWILPWGIVQTESHCAVALPPQCARDLDQHSLDDSNESAAQRTPEPQAANGTAQPFQSLAQRLSPAGISYWGRPSLKRMLGWSWEMAAALEALHRLDFSYGLLSPTAVLVSPEKRVGVLGLPVQVLRTPGLASAMGWGRLATNSEQAAGFQPEIRLGATEVSGPIANPAATETGNVEWLPLLQQPFRRRFPMGWQPADFLAPEQSTTLGPGAMAADWYAFGRMMTWMLRLEWPEAFPGMDDHNPAPPLEWAEKATSAIPKPIRQMLQSLLAVDPGERPQDPGEVRERLAAILKIDQQVPQRLIPKPTPQVDVAHWFAQWPDRRWTEDVEAIRAEDLPTLRASSELPVIRLDGSSGASRSAGQDSGGALPPPALETAEGVDSSGSPRVSGHRVWNRDARRRFKWSSPPLIACYVSGAAMLILLGLIWFNRPGESTWVDGSDPRSAQGDAGEGPSPGDQENVPPPETSDSDSEAQGWQQQILADDGRLLWESPTVGLPLEIEGLPNNPTALLVIDRSWWSIPELSQLLSALDGPAREPLSDSLQSWLDDWQVARFDRTAIGQYQTSTGTSHAFVLDTESPIELSLPGWKIVAKLGEFTFEDDSRDADAHAKGEPSDSLSTADADEGLELASSPLRHWILVREPRNGDSPQVMWLQLRGDYPELENELPELPLDRVDVRMFDPEMAESTLADQTFAVERMIIADGALMKEALANLGETLVTGPMANLLAYSDRDRQIQLIVNPVTLWNAPGMDWLGERWRWIGELVKNHVPPAARMLSLSIHQLDTGESYVELKLIADRSQSPGTAVGPLAEQIRALPGQVERQLLGLPRIAFWETALLRYDDMLQDVASLVRAGQHEKIPMLNAWLRPGALNNLLASSELYSMAIRLNPEGGPTVVARDPGTGTPANLEELLSRPRRLNIPEQDLINALAELQTEVRAGYPELPFNFSIELDGTALRIEGITQNQKISNFRIDDQPLAEILTALVLKANPNPAVTSAKDPLCKLIWLVDPRQPDGRILVTTRAAAAENGWTLPPQVTPE